jgi:rhamnosyltransferase
MNTPKISVIIPTRNGERFLDRSLKAVFAQKTRFTFEVIIVDSGSTDMTAQIALGYPVRFYRINPEDFNHGLTRNFAISLARGEYAVLLTQDAVPCNSLWLDKLAMVLEVDSCVAGAYSRHFARDDSSLIAQARVRGEISSQSSRIESFIDDLDKYSKFSMRQKRRLCSFDNVSSCVRKSVWEKIPFPESEFAEDIKWAQRVLMSGFKIVFEPESSVYHSHDYSPAEWFKRNQTDARNLAVIFGPCKRVGCLEVLLGSASNSWRDINFSVSSGKDIVSIFSSSCLAPAFALAGAIGRYVGEVEASYTYKK